MNIAVVCGHFLPKLGYIEVHLAQALARSGHRVTVVTTNAVPAYVEKLHEPIRAGVSDYDGLKVHRLSPYMSLGQIVIARGVSEAVASTTPDLVVVIGLGKRFPKPVFRNRFRTVTLLGDNEFSYTGSTVRSRLLFAMLKRSTYVAAIRKSDHLVAYTPESFGAAAAAVGGPDAQRLLGETAHLSLGFWPEDFFFSPDLRAWKRRALGFTDRQKVAITATRITAEKGLEEAIALFEKLPETWSWLVVGSDGGAYAKRFEELGMRALGSGRFKVLPFQPRAVLNALYNAADMALYTVPAISIFEAIGTGLPCALPNESSLTHILDYAIGFSYTELAGDSTVREFGCFDCSETSRHERMSLARRHFSWKAIGERLLTLIQAPKRIIE